MEINFHRTIHTLAGHDGQWEKNYLLLSFPLCQFLSLWLFFYHVLRADPHFHIPRFHISSSASFRLIPRKKKEIIINLSMNWPILNTSEWQRTGHTLILVNTRYKVTLHNEVQRDWVEISSVCSRTCGPLIIFLLHMNHVIFEMLIFLGKSTPCRKLSFTLIIMENILMFYPLQPFCTVLSLHSNIPIWCKNITFILCKVTGVLILHCLQMQLTQTYL